MSGGTGVVRRPDATGLTERCSGAGPAFHRANAMTGVKAACQADLLSRFATSKARL
jgi:hypothetical protein